MSLIIKNELLRSNRKTIAVTKLMLCISMVMALFLMGLAFSTFTLTFISTAIFLLALLTVILLILMIITLKNFEIYENGICIAGINIPWEDVMSLQMPFQHRRLLLLIYKERNKRKYAILIANKIKGKKSFIPKELFYGYQTELEKYIRLKINQEKGSGLFT